MSASAPPPPTPPPLPLSAPPGAPGALGAASAAGGPDALAIARVPATPRWRLAFVVAWLAVMAIAVRLAWLGDDCYITLRSVENWCSGHGLRWNPVERVQTYTHPAWMLLLAGGRALTGEVYFTTLAISLALSGAAVALLLRSATTVPALVATAVLLAGTRAFGEYSTSGLETPLTFALLALLVREVLAPHRVPLAPLARYRRVVLLSALLAANRMDLALLCLPVALAALRGVRWRDAILHGALAAAPFLAWLAYAWFWYGTPLPVTAHAKAFGMGIPAADLFVQGCRYALFAVHDDPVLLPAIVLGIAVGFATRGARALALGALLYCGYVVRVGGDFMAGRFFLPPFVVAAAILARWLVQRRPPIVGSVAAVLAVLAAARGVPTWLRAPSSERGLTTDEIDAQHGIADERRGYVERLGLFSPGRSIPVPAGLEQLLWPDGRRERWVTLCGAVGIAGYEAGPRAHVLDPLLCDPLLARLPARSPKAWRIGHVLRRVPEGYWETLRSGENRIHHPGLHAWYELLRRAMCGPLLGRERLAAVAGLALGHADDGFRAFVAEDYHTPPRIAIDAGAVAELLPAGVHWFDEPRARVVYQGGVAVYWPEPRSERRVRVQVAGLCDFRFRFVRRGAVVADTVQQQPPLTGVLAHDLTLRDCWLEVPEGVAFDTLWIDLVENPLSATAVGPPTLGGIGLVP